MVNNVSRRYELFVEPGYKLHYWPGPNGKRGQCKLHIGDDPAIDAVLIQRIEADLASKAAAPAPAPAPAPVQEVLRPRARRSSTPVNIGHAETGARFATNRPSKHEQESLTKKRKSDRAEEQHQLKRVPELERFVNIARARARTAERERDRLKGCSQALAALRAEHDKTSQELQALGELNENAEDALAKLSQVPVFRMVSKGKGGGRGRLWPHWLRLMCYEQLVNGTKPSAVAKNIVSDAAWLVPWLEVKVPVVRTIRRLRYEIRSLGRALAALRVAAAARVLALGCDARKSMAEVDADLNRTKAKGGKISYLKDQIKVRVVGFGWGDLRVKWSAGGVDRGVDDLRAELAKILKEEESREVPSEPPVPDIQRKTLKQLGSMTAQFDDLARREEVKKEEFKRRVDAERARRDSAGETDPFQRKQPPAAPSVESLEGRHIEYREEVTFEDGTKDEHWFAGVVKQVSDGSVPRGGRSKKKYDVGFARVVFDAQPALGETEPTEKWVALRPNKFNGNAKNCWRLDLDFN